MRKVLRIIGNILGLALNFLGGIGSSDQMATWGQWFSDVHRILGSPWVYFPLTIGGSAVLAVAWGDYWKEVTLARAGGLTKREFPARFSNWDRVSVFQISDVAWLWVGLEPQDGGLVGTSALAVSHRLTEDRKELGPDSSRLDRQRLIDYAIKNRERPKFLFKQYRHIWDRYRHQLRHRTIRYEVAESEYRSMSEIDTAYFQLRSRSEMFDSSMPSQMQNFYSDQLLSGKWEAVGRLVIDGYSYEYEVIAPWKWEFQSHVSRNTWFYDEEYSHIRIKMLWD